MPHLAIDYSSRLAGVLDPGALARELHPLVVEESSSTGVCKTLFRPVETYVGDPTGRETVFVHVEVGLMPGRSEARKARLSERILALLAGHLPGDGAAGAVFSVEVRDLSASYRLGAVPARSGGDTAAPCRPGAPAPA
ncbi:5-carboxymethyl-2-hydroxymuconate Delta-isomerase [Streptomyces sp. NPDC015684]|uniref:5-carboxymethyl-2-hydroxymuconate Delta-isomerase n=1 Tax=Streptomyces sp. NPDC015684 TaxID=3364963 RepID=UPI0036F76C0D